MESFFRIRRDQDSEGVIRLHPEVAKFIGITRWTERIFFFGSQSLRAPVYTSHNLQENEVGISSDILDQLNIPLNCHYEILLKGDEIHFGPFIGILAGNSSNSLNSQLEDLLDYLLYYSEIKGAVLVFSLEGVNKEDRTIKGYLFNPRSKQWEKGTFPYPSSIFVLTKKASSKWIKHFQSVIGDAVFNDFHYNKWNIHKILESSYAVKDYLPHSILYESPEELYSFLEKYSKVMVKSISTSKESYIYKISKENNYIIFTNPQKGESKKIRFAEKDQVYEVFAKYFKAGEYMIQQSIELQTTHDRTIDFRVIVIKNPKGKWQAMNMFARQGKPGTVLSNIYPFVELGKETLKEVWDLNEVKTAMLVKEIADKSIEAVKVIEEKGVHFANASVDVKVDENEAIWILDVQHRNPSHEIALVAGFPDLYYEILKTNMLYAKKLAGFN
ncbi:YheC/YheD family protein [Paenibacillus sp. BSR1-1]|uniref:YheC/YheD family endospore coat-associated protein n=1 Tax=Paenibacillus sp. BSR1-1 TaxID=3020845 RepID=UPI0025B06EC8|nr:YheC/YheD family protein [Paenibacillus sp. BSR1-1]MDN3015349.1 YheC/YheD family protein [Paenibacillus sp. BSR1-1]